MESFWESIADMLILAMKVLLGLFILRTILFFAGYTLYIPYMDEILVYVTGLFR